MKAFSLVLVLLASAQYSFGYGYGSRDSNGYSSGYTSSYTSSSSSSGSSSYASCCQLNTWAYGHMDVVRQLASRLRQEFNTISRGSSTGYGNAYDTQWSVEIINLTGKTASELNEWSRRLSQDLVNDMRQGLFTYSTVSTPNFFEYKAANALEEITSMTASGGQHIIDFGDHYQPVDLSNYDEVKNYAYPSEVKVIDGKTYIVHKNCTEATKTIGTGSYDNPLITVLKRNRTIITSGGAPTYTINGGINSGAMLNGGITSYPGTTYIRPGGGGSTTTTTVRQNMKNWMTNNMEPTVMGYNPVVSLPGYTRNPVHISIEGTQNPEVETFIPGGTMYRPGHGPPGSTVTINRYNKTIITNPDGTTSVMGSESNKKWVDGKLVYDTERPFGEWSVPRDEEWKREERERFFWFLSNTGALTAQNLESWQRQQEERLLALSSRYHCSLDQIQEFHRKELDRYKVLLSQYQAQNRDLTEWKRLERGRLDWLIHQNSLTREDFERWQRENQDRLRQLAMQYRISLEELKNWQVQELDRLYIYFNDQNNSMITHPMPGSLHIDEQERLEELIRQHNATISQLQSSIRLDQQKLRDLTKMFGGNVQDMEKWLKEELARLSGIIKDQNNEMTRITEWQRSERLRLENIVNQHHGSIQELEAQIARDRNYIQTLATKYHVSIEEIEKWQRAELERLRNEGTNNFELNMKEWQRREHEHLKSIINKNDLTIEEFQMKIVNDRARLEQLANTYKIQVSEIEEWIKNEIKNFQSQGLLKEVEKELAIWQQKERERLLGIVHLNEITVEELESKIKNDQSHLFALANTHQVRVEEIEEWLKKELLRLQNQGLIKAEDLKDWQKNERNEIMKIVQENKLTIEEFERKLLTDRSRLQDLSTHYNVKITEIESWIKKEGERLQNLGLLAMQEQLNNWQRIERDRLLALITQNNLSIEELEEKIKKDQTHLHSLAYQHQVRVEEIEEWIKKEIKKLQEQGVIEMGKLKDWQTEWRGNITNMVHDRDFTVEEFHKWLLEDRARLQALAMQHNVQIEEIEQWVKNEEQRFIGMGLLKPNEKLTNWQEMERLYLERITQERYRSTEQLEERLRQDRELLERLAREYSIQVEEVEMWMKKELARMRDEGKLQIENLTSWQIAERERLEALIKQNKQWSVEEFEALLRKDREHMQTLAFQYHTSVEEIERWLQTEVDRLRKQGKLNIENLTVWQKTEQERIINLLNQQTGITVEEFKRKVQDDHSFLINLANQYHVSVVEIEEYVKKVIEELRNKGKFNVGNLQVWQIVERDYIKQMLEEHNNQLSTTEFEQQLLRDRAHLLQLADQYHVDITQIEKWMVEELQRLRQGSEMKVNELSAWQIAEAERLKNLIKHNNHLSYVEYEVELMKERARLQELANQYAVNVEQIEQWLRQQLINLKTTGQIQVESLTQWQEAEQKRLIEMLLQQQNNISFDEFEKQLRQDRARLVQLSQQYRISVEQIERWMRDELERLRNSGLVQVEQLTYWQKIERDRLREWLQQQNNDATYKDLQIFLSNDKDRLLRIAQDYHVTVEEVEAWVQQEAARLKFLGMVKGPGKYIITWEKHYNTTWGGNVDMGDLWKEQTLAQLKAMSLIKPMNWQQFEQYLKDERMRWEQFARQYNITVEEIEVWLRKNAEIQPGIIEGTVTIEEWQANEQLHIENLIDEFTHKQLKWTIEELERKLKNDRAYLQQLAMKYHIAIEEIEAWYKLELQRLLNQHKIISEHLVDWQRREKERLYQTIIRQPGKSYQYWVETVINDRQRLNGLADEYHVTIEQLEYWIRNELRRLVNLGFIQDWQSAEKQRLRTIAAEITITQEEFLEFISTDIDFQNQLASIYSVGLSDLAPFQRVVIENMKREHLLDNIQLLYLENWQKLERDRLYNLIKNQNFTLKNLQDWQNQDRNTLNQYAAKYGISVEVLKQWQLKEFNRFIKLAEYYQMSLMQLQDFRDKELAYLTYIMHEKTSNEEQRAYWVEWETKRIETLSRTCGRYGADLAAWRRKLYLLCQGLIPLDFGNGGVINGNSNSTNIPQPIFSKDRGDQPPHVYVESGEHEEPGLEDDKRNPLYPQPPAQLIESTTVRYVRPLPIGGGGVTGGYRYTKKEDKYTVPVGVATASASASGSSSSAAASATGRYGREMDTQQQQQQDVEDLGQQQQEELAWNSKYSDGGQQQVVEHGYGGGSRGGSYGSTSSSHGSYASGRQQAYGGYGKQQAEDLGQQQQVELDDYQQQQQVEHVGGNYGGHASEKQVNGAAVAHSETEVQAEQEKPGFFGRLKDKATNLFG